MKKKVIIFMFWVVIILGGIVYFNNVKNQKLEKSKSEIKKENIIETNEFAEVRIEPETTTDKEVEEFQKIEDIKEEPIKQEQTLEEVKKEKQEPKMSSNKTEARVEIQKQEKQKVQEESKKEHTFITQTTENKQEEQEKIKEPEITEEYKTNDQMINKIKTIIENNETDDMKTYGYEIVVDSTIPELTNEFTFTEQRVINKITWKCGIIRIYARDYYFNGNHISTQCFII